jgi:sulfoxide reductase heme-binding subunit YedZ
VVGEDFIPQPVIYALLAALLLAWRYKKFRQWWR